MIRKSLFLLLTAALLLSACTTPLLPEVPSAQAQPSEPTVRPTAAPPTATATAYVPPEPAAPTPTLSPIADVEQVARDYFAALETGNPEAAAEQLSTFSLMVAGITRGDAAAELNQQLANGAKWSELEILDSQSFDEQTALVSVRYRLETKAPKPTTAVAAGTPTPTPGPVVETREESWPLRNENGVWRYNWLNLIDYHTLETGSQTVNGITVKPTRLLRYSDRMRLVMIVQNRSNEPVVFGQRNETLATFTFGEQPVEAETVQYVFDRLRSYPNVTLDIPGLWDAYPTGLELRRWKDYQVEPWYRFTF